MPNVLTNQRIDDWPALRSFYNEFFWDTAHVEWMQDFGRYRRLRMITQQYQKFKTRVSKFTTIMELLFWANDCAHEVLTVPMNYVDNRRKPAEPRSVDIRQVWQNNDINTMFRFLNGSDEELIGPGWHFEMVVEPILGKKFDADAWRFGMASYGFYLAEGEWTTVLSRNVWVFQGVILRRDFNITDAEGHRWSYVDAVEDSDDDDEDEISDWHDANRRAWAIEEGLADDDVFGDGYAR